MTDTEKVVAKLVTFIEYLIIFTGHLFLLVLFLLVAWFFNISSTDVVSYYSDISNRSELITAVSWSIFLFGLTGVFLLRKYRKLLRWLMQKTIGKSLLDTLNISTK